MRGIPNLAAFQRRRDLAIGPDKDEKIDAITGHLKLL
jgi:peptidyl-tRNA hydrolase